MNMKAPQEGRLPTVREIGRLPQPGEGVAGVIPPSSGVEIGGPPIVAAAPTLAIALAGCAGGVPAPPDVAPAVPTKTSETLTTPGFQVEQVPSGLTSYDGFIVDSTGTRITAPSLIGEGNYSFTVVLAQSPQGDRLPIRFAQYIDTQGNQQITPLWPVFYQGTVNGKEGREGIQFYTLNEGAIGQPNEEGKMRIDFSRENLGRPFYSIFFQEGKRYSDFINAYHALVEAGKGNDISLIRNLIDQYVDSFAIANPNAADEAEANRTATVINYHSQDQEIGDLLVSLLSGAQPAYAASSEATIQVTATAPLATATPTSLPTEAPTPEPTATVQPLETQRAAIDAATSLAKTLTNAGIKTSAADILKQGLQQKTFTGKDGKTYSVALTADGYPILIQNVDGNWEQIQPILLQQASGIQIGMSSWIGFTESWNPEFKKIGPIYDSFGTNMIDGETQWYIPWSPTDGLRPTKTTYNYTNLDKALRIGKSEKIIIQTLLAPSQREYLPDWLLKQTDPREIRQIALENQRGVLTHMRQLLGEKNSNNILAIGVASELTNNPYASAPNFWRERLGISSLVQLSPENLQWLVDAYREAKAIFPNAKLYYSDFMQENGGAKADEIFNFVKQLKNAGAPIDAVAFQLHLQGKDLDTPAKITAAMQQLKAQIQRYKKIGVDVIPSEIDINMTGVVSGDSRSVEAIQAEAMYSLIRTLKSEGINMYSFFNPVDDEYNWIIAQGIRDGMPGLFHEDGTPKLNFFAVMKALLE